MRGLLHSLVGVALLAGAAQAEFATNRPAAPSSLTPQAPATPVTPDSPSAHPWYVKPEYGQWMICVKSYSGEKAKLNAEALATDIRERYKVPAYLFERGAVERQQEQDRHARELAKKRAEQADQLARFSEIQAKAKAEAASKGMDFLESKPQIKAATVRYEEQYAVLIGGWPTMDAARKEMEKVRRWDPPSNPALMDRQFIVRDGSNGGQASGEMVSVNPFKSGMVVPNPAAPRQIDTEGEADTRFLLKLNSDEEYSVLKIKKNWTIAVKQFAPPHQVKDKEEKSFVAKLLSTKPDAMAAAGEQARSMAQWLRSMKPTEKFPYGPYEAYVLHTRYGSLVCVGQFDGPEDPKLIEVQNQLGTMKFNLRAEDSKNASHVNQMETRIFDRLYAMKVR